MKFLILVSWLAASACLVVVRADDVFVDGVRHQIEVLTNRAYLLLPHSLAIDYTSDDLYLVDKNQAAIFNLNTKELKYITGVTSVYPVSVDEDTQDLYIGTWQGVYKYSPSSAATALVGAAGLNIWQVYHRKLLYYTDYITDRVSTLINGQSAFLTNMPFRVLNFVIDKDDVMFFSNRSGLFSQHLESDRATLHYAETYVYNLAVNKHGQVYFTSDNGIYEIIKSNGTYRRLVSMLRPRGIALDNDNHIIYSDANGIYRLTPIEGGGDECVCIRQQNDHTYYGNVVKQQEIKLDIMDKKIDKLETDMVNMLESMNTKMDQLVADRVASTNKTNDK